MHLCTCKYKFIDKSSNWSFSETDYKQSKSQTGTLLHPRQYFADHNVYFENVHGDDVVRSLPDIVSVVTKVPFQSGSSSDSVQNAYSSTEYCNESEFIATDTTTDDGHSQVHAGNDGIIVYYSAVHPPITEMELEQESKNDIALPPSPSLATGFVKNENNVEEKKNENESGSVFGIVDRSNDGLIVKIFSNKTT